jgi:hypothetical protein
LLVGDLGAFLEGFEPMAVYPGVVDEEIFAAIIRGDETVALIVVEPLIRNPVIQWRND